MKRILQSRALHLSLIWLFFIKSCSYCFEIRLSDGELRQYYREIALDYQPEIVHYEENGQPIRYYAVGNDSLPALVLLHGAPSSSSYYLRYTRNTDLLKYCKMYMIDRPGYGFSSFGRPQLEVADQAKSAYPMLRKIAEKHKKVVVVGSSYGGTLAARLAIDYPELMDAVLFVSSSVAPAEETIYTISYFMEWKPIAWFFATPFVVANKEKLSHEKTLRNMEALWHKIKARIYVLHGDADPLIWPTNAFYIRNKVQQVPVELTMVPKVGHSIPFQYQDVLIRQIIRILNDLGVGPEAPTARLSK